MRAIKFTNDYETITTNKEYEVLSKSYTDDSFEYLFFLDNINDEIMLKQSVNPIPSDLFEVIEIDN